MNEPTPAPPARTNPIERSLRASLSRSLVGKPRTWQHNALLAASFSAQALVSAAILLIGYRFADSTAVAWAIISAIVVLQPGMQQSLAASVTRIVANIVGAAVGLGIGLAFGSGSWQLLVGLVAVIILCQFLRLDDGLRIACIAVVIVLSMHLTSVLHSALERSLAVIIGCVVGSLVQLGAERVSRALGVHDLLFATPIAPHTGTK